jgi:hypothetical protein
MNNAHITLFIPSFRGGGAEKMIIYIANELNHRGYDIELISVDASSPWGSVMTPSIRSTGIGGHNIFIVQYNLWQHLKRSDTDVLLSTMEVPNITTTIATRPPIFIPVMLGSASVYSKRNRSAKHKLIPILKRFIYPTAEAIVTISDGIKQEVNAGLFGKHLIFEFSNRINAKGPIDL